MTAEQFKAIRKASTFTQKELAKRLRVHWRTVQKWEAGDRKVPGPVAVLMDQADAEALKWRKKQ